MSFLFIVLQLFERYSTDVNLTKKLYSYVIISKILIFIEWAIPCQCIIPWLNNSLLSFGKKNYLFGGYICFLFVCFLIYYITPSIGAWKYQNEVLALMLVNVVEGKPGCLNSGCFKSAKVKAYSPSSMIMCGLFTHLLLCVASMLSFIGFYHL